MREEVYMLTPLGRRALAGEVSTVPPQLRELLGAINGQRTRDEILQICGRSAVNAGGLSWLASAGYLERHAALGKSVTTLAGDPGTSAGRATGLGPGAAPTVPTPASAPTEAPTRVLAPRTSSGDAEGETTHGPSTQASLLPMQDALAAFLIETVRRYLPEEAEQHRRRVLQAQSLTELLTHLNPLIDAVLDVAGPHAAAEIADGAAAILQPAR